MTNFLNTLKYRTGSGNTCMGETVITTVVKVRTMAELYGKHQANQSPISVQAELTPTQAEAILIQYDKEFTETQEGFDENTWYAYPVNEQLMHLTPVCSRQLETPLKYILTLQENAINTYVASIHEDDVKLIDETYESKQALPQASVIYTPI